MNNFKDDLELTDEGDIKLTQDIEELQNQIKLHLGFDSSTPMDTINDIISGKHQERMRDKMRVVYFFLEFLYATGSVPSKIADEVFDSMFAYYKPIGMPPISEYRRFNKQYEELTKAMADE